MSAFHEPLYSAAAKDTAKGGVPEELDLSLTTQLQPQDKPKGGELLDEPIGEHNSCSYGVCD